jgi:hypothetical protein
MAVHELFRLTHRRQARARVRPSILSPTTRKPLLEDALGVDNFRYLRRILESDERLSNDGRLAVVFKVFSRRDEIDGRTSLDRIAREEADKKVANM